MLSTRFFSVLVVTAALCYVAAPAFADGTAASTSTATAATAATEPKLSAGAVALRITVSVDQERQARRLERRLRIVRYVAQVVDGLVSSAGYSRFSRTCLPCIAFARLPVGNVRTISSLRFPAEADPVVQPISHGGFAMLALGALAYDALDARIERHWTPRARIAADSSEIALHAYGLATWQAANSGLALEEKRASNCASIFHMPDPAHISNYSGVIQWCIARFAEPDFDPSIQGPTTTVAPRR